MWFGWAEESAYLQGIGSHSFQVHAEENEMQDKKSKIRKQTLGIERPLQQNSDEVEIESSLPGPLIAKKDFSISHNEYVRHIKLGDDISDVPEQYHQNLRTEGVL